MNRLFSVLIALLMVVCAHAQKIKISGTVKDAKGESVPGVTVKVQGQKVATMTSIDGKFIIEADKDATLQFTSVGYNTVSVPVKGKSQLTVTLAETSEELNEVVITVPYGTRKKSTFTGSAGVVTGEKIANSQVASVSKALQGTVAGLQSFATSGQPGEDASVYIRGVGSVNASSDPLYVVDGVPYDGKLANINSQDIASVTVLKDAAAASLYGSRAANGVVMITTKQGSQGATPTIELTAKYGFSSRAVADYDQLTTNEYFELQWEAMRNKYLNDGLSTAEAATKASRNVTKVLGINPYGSQYAQPVGTDGKIVSGATPLWDDSWEDAMTQNAHYTDLSARVSGGSKNSKYYLSLGYLDDQGAYICSGFKRYNVRANITSNLKSWLQVGMNLSGAHSSQSYPKQNDTRTDNVVLFARNMPSFYPVYERDPDTGAYRLDESGNRIPDYGTYRANSYSGMNLAHSMFYDKHERNRDAATVQGFIKIDPIRDLSYKMTVNLDYNSLFQQDYSNPTYGKNPVGTSYKGNTRTTGFTINNVINYEHTFCDKHNVHAMAGQEYYEYNTSNFNGQRSGVIAEGYYEPDVASTLVSFGGNSDQYKLLSFFGSAEYSYKRTYFASVSLRSDGSSRFAPGNRWGTFWSFGGSWRITNEKWMQPVKWVDNLTLRASYGAQGNDNVGYYAYQALYSIGKFQGENALHASRMATPELTWETNLNTNVGLDFSFFGDRLSGTVEYFERASKDLLFARSLVPSSGYSSIDANIGKLKNYGWEFTLNGTPIRTKDWTWKLSVNATTYKNKIEELPSDVMWQSSKKWVKGGSLYDFWLYEWAGVNPDNGNPQWYYYDDEGNKQVTEDYNSLNQEKDKVKCGSSLPSLSGGFSTDVRWKGLTLSAQFSYALGGKLYNSDYVNMIGVAGGNGNTLSKNMLNRWTEDNRYTDIPKLVYSQTSYFTSSSSRWLVSRSYLRLKTVTLNYQLPQALVKSAYMKDVNVFVQAENLFTLHSQQGLDPEQPLSGMVQYRYPAMKTISFGINVKL